MTYYTEFGPIENAVELPSDVGPTVYASEDLPERILKDARNAVLSVRAATLTNRHYTRPWYVPDGEYMAQAERLAGIARLAAYGKIDIPLLLRSARSDKFAARAHVLLADSTCISKPPEIPNARQTVLQLRLIPVYDGQYNLHVKKPIKGAVALECVRFRQTDGLVKLPELEEAVEAAWQESQKDRPCRFQAGPQVHDPTYWMVPDNLEALMHAQGMNKVDTASACGVSPLTLDAYLGKGTASYPTMGKIRKFVAKILPMEPVWPSWDDRQTFAWTYGLDPSELPDDPRLLLDMSLRPVTYGLAPVREPIKNPTELSLAIEKGHVSVAALAREAKVTYGALYSYLRNGRTTIKPKDLARVSYILETCVNGSTPDLPDLFSYTEPPDPAELARFRAAYGLSYKKLSMLSNLATHAIMKYEHGETDLQPRSARKLSAAIMSIQAELDPLDKLLERPERANTAKVVYPLEYKTSKKQFKIDSKVEQAVLAGRTPNLSRQGMAKVMAWLDYLEGLDQAPLAQRVAQYLEIPEEELPPEDELADMMFRRKYAALAKAVSRDREDVEAKNATAWYVREGQRWREAVRRGIASPQDQIRWQLSVASAHTVEEMITADRNQLDAILYAYLGKPSKPEEKEKEDVNHGNTL